MTMSKANPTLSQIAESIEASGIDGAMWSKYYKCFHLYLPPCERELPVYGWKKNDLKYSNDVAETKLSYSRCAKEGRPVKEGELPIAWIRVMYGFAPLFDRSV